MTAVPSAGPSPETLRAVAEEVRTAFPRPSRAKELVLIDVDPRRVHAFWDIPHDSMQAARADLADGGSGPLVLRIVAVDGTSETTVSLDVEVQGLQSQTYVEIWDEPRRYQARLGLRRPDGTLLLLAESNPVDLPALGPAATLPGTEGAQTDEATATAAAAGDDHATVLPLEKVLAVSSFALGRHHGELEVSAELHVFGRVKVGSDVSLLGRRVILRPDGSFSVTRPLPAGSFLLKALLADFAAASE